MLTEKQNFRLLIQIKSLAWMFFERKQHIVLEKILRKKWYFYEDDEGKNKVDFDGEHIDFCHVLQTTFILTSVKTFSAKQNVILIAKKVLGNISTIVLLFFTTMFKISITMVKLLTCFYYFL